MNILPAVPSFSTSARSGTDPVPGSRGLRSDTTDDVPAPDAAPPGKPDYVPGQILVKFEPGVSLNDVITLSREMGLKTLHRYEVPSNMLQAFGGELYQFALRQGDTVEEAVARLSGRPGLSYAEPNYRVQLDAPMPAPTQATGEQEGRLPDDLDPRLWGLRNTGLHGGKAGVDIGATQAWTLTTGAPNGQGPVIAVIDTGVDHTHPDLAANLWKNPGEVPGDGIDNDGNGIVDDVHGANMAYKSGDPMDDSAHGHGTHVTGTVAAVGNNGQGVVGVNWTATVAGVKFLDWGGGGDMADAVRALFYASSIGARVTSHSWGSTGFSQALYDAFKACPALHITSAGNKGLNTDREPHYPSGFDLDNIVCVGAHDRKGRLAAFSNYGATTVDVLAPGVDIYSTTPANTFTTLSGTSMATPHVTGVAGLLLARDPSLTNEQLKSRLIHTAVQEEAYKDLCVAGGRVSAIRAMECDDVPPAAPGDFRVTAAHSTGMALQWTATGDKPTEGKATSYQIRYAERPIVEDPDGVNTVGWDQSTPIRELPPPQEPGQTETLWAAVPPSQQSKTVYFALRVLDRMGNASEMATAQGVCPAAVVSFHDDMESDDNNWALSGRWGKVEVKGHGQVFTDSPEGAYAPNSDTALTSRSIDLTGVSYPRLLYKMKQDTEGRFDLVRVEASRDGENWTELLRQDGTSDWKSENVDLSAFEGEQNVRIRFRLTSDGTVQKDGVYVDDVMVAGVRGRRGTSWEGTPHGRPLRVSDLPTAGRPSCRVQSQPPQRGGQG